MFGSEDTIVKLYAPEAMAAERSAVGAMVVERSVLAALAEAGGLAIPKVLGEGTVEVGERTLGYLVMERLPGTSVGGAWAVLSLPDWIGLARFLGTLLRRVHETPIPEAVPRAVVHGAPGSAVPPHLREQVPSFLDRFRTRAHDGTERLLHGDVHDGNVLVARNGDGAGGATYRGSGLVDFERSHGGDPTSDLVAAHLRVLGGSRRLFETMVTAYGSRLDPTRLLAEAIVHPLDLFGALLRARPALLQEPSLERVAEAAWGP